MSEIMAQRRRGRVVGTHCTIGGLKLCRYANADARSKRGCTAILMAAEEGHVDIMTALLLESNAVGPAGAAALADGLRSTIVTATSRYSARPTSPSTVHVSVLAWRVVGSQSHSGPKLMINSGVCSRQACRCRRRTCR